MRKSKDYTPASFISSKGSVRGFGVVTPRKLKSGVIVDQLREEIAGMPVFESGADVMEEARRAWVDIALSQQRLMKAKKRLMVAMNSMPSEQKLIFSLWSEEQRGK